MKGYDEEPIEAVCPVCGCTRGKQLWSVDSRQSARHFVLPEADPQRHEELAAHIASLWQSDRCRVVRCDCCRFCYSWPFVAGDARFYALAYPNHGYPKWKWEYDAALDWIAEGQTSERNLLEIGAGKGAFAAALINCGFPKERIVCTEFSAGGRAAINKLGIRCLPDDVRNLSGPDWDGRFDLVCMFQVIEHMDRLDELFARLAVLIRPGGRLIAAVPNPAMIEFNELNGALRDMPPCHVGRWNVGCFEQIGRRFGFERIKSAVEPGRWMSMAAQFVGYRLLQRSQTPDSWANRAFRVRRRPLRRAAQAAMMFVVAVGAVRPLLRLHRGLGNALIVCLERQRRPEQG